MCPRSTTVPDYETPLPGAGGQLQTSAASADAQAPLHLMDKPSVSVFRFNPLNKGSCRENKAVMTALLLVGAWAQAPPAWILQLSGVVFHMLAPVQMLLASITDAHRAPAALPVRNAQGYCPSVRLGFLPRPFLVVLLLSRT